MRKKQTKKQEEETKPFRPTPAMQLYVMKCIELGFDKTQTEIAEAIGIHPSQISIWKQSPEFEPWCEEQKCIRLKPIMTQLEIVALLHIENFKYWEALAKRYGYIVDDQKSLPLRDVDELTPEQQKFKDDYLAYLEARK